MRRTSRRKLRNCSDSVTRCSSSQLEFFTTHSIAVKFDTVCCPFCLRIPDPATVDDMGLSHHRLRHGQPLVRSRTKRPSWKPEKQSNRFYFIFSVVSFASLTYADRNSAARSPSQQALAYPLVTTISSVFRTWSGSRYVKRRPRPKPFQRRVSHRPPRKTLRNWRETPPESGSKAV